MNCVETVFGLLKRRFYKKLHRMEVNLATMQQFHEMVLRVCSQYPISIPAMIRSNKRYLEAHHDISIVSESDSFYSAHSRERECLEALH